MFMADMMAFTGYYILIPLHIGHNVLNKLHVSVYNASVYNIHTRFLAHYADLCYSSLSALGIDKEDILDRERFENGEMTWIYKLDLLESH